MVDGENVVTGTHFYADNGPYLVTFKVTDDDGGFDSDGLFVTVANAPPVVSAGDDAFAFEGDPVTVSASFTDAGSGDTHTALVDFGDGTVVAGTIDPLTGLVSASHVYTDDGIFTVTISVTDDDGDTGIDTLSANLNNRPPIAIAASYSINEDNVLEGVLERTTSTT